MMDAKYAEALQMLVLEDNLRELPGTLPQYCINLSSNDYLGLNEDVVLRQTFLSRMMSEDTRFSAASSRLLTGNCEVFAALEDSIAGAYQREACLVFNSGYHANIGILPSLSAKGDLLLADKLVHASIIDGMKLCKADIMRYKHLDYEHLEAILQKYRNQYDRVFIISESIFSMDGDKCDIRRLILLKKQYNCFLYLDEAHAFGVYGMHGLGCAEESGCIEDCDFIVATFGKALASVGAFLVCNEVIKRYLINHARSFIFTTALPPINLSWTLFLFEMLQHFNDRRTRLMELGTAFSGMLGITYQSHIIPYHCGSNRNAIALSSQLRMVGIHVLPIRYPTVPKGKARLRFSLTSDITLSQLKTITPILRSYEPAMDQ